MELFENALQRSDRCVFKFHPHNVDKALKFVNLQVKSFWVAVFGSEDFYGGFSVFKEIFCGFPVSSRPSLNTEQVITHGNLSVIAEGSLRLRKGKTSFQADSK